MSLNSDETIMLAHIQGLVGNHQTEAFLAAMKDQFTGDRLSAVLQFLAGEGFGDDIVTALVWALSDPTFGAANAPLELIQGIAYILIGSSET